MNKMPRAIAGQISFGATGHNNKRDDRLRPRRLQFALLCLLPHLPVARAIELDNFIAEINGTICPSSAGRSNACSEQSRR
jgi:hypothetical protein